VVERDEGAVALLAELVEMYDLPEETPLMTYRQKGEWKVWEREKATERLREGVGWVGQKRRSEGGEWVPILIRRSFRCIQDGRGATRLVMMGVSFEVIKLKGGGS